MKTKFLLSMFFFCFLSHAQYSNYYNVNVNARVNSNINANINHNVSGIVYENKTITTIDYGALQQANAQREKNALEQQKFNDEKQRQMALEIANDPIKAYDYGTWFYISTKEKKKWPKEVLKNVRELSGLKEFRIDYLSPSYLVFNQLNAYQLQNVSKDGIVTDIYIFLPIKNKNKVVYNLEKEIDEIIIGKEIEDTDENGKPTKTFSHKKDLNRATVFGNKGYRSTVAWEDKFENHITDTYVYYDERFGDGVKYSFKVRYNGDKDEIDFEKLEGRRYYLKGLIEKIISTARISELVLD